jgi:anti-sigma factor RsiW
MSDEELDQLLKTKLPRHEAPAALKDKLSAQLAARAPAAPAAAIPIERKRKRQWLWPTASALAAALIVLLAVRITKPGFVQRDPLWDELVNDHLRVVTSQHPIDIESGGVHQVKPWFTGRLDFAPPVSFSGDADFPLRGGSVGYVGERRAALFLFGRRLHTISLWIFPADGAGLPAQAARTTRGFNVLAWRDSGLAFALVSDISHGELEQLQAKLRAP